MNWEKDLIKYRREKAEKYIKVIEDYIKRS